MKQAIVARTDLGMGAGSWRVQVAHASLMAFEDSDRQARSDWKGQGQKKVVLKASGRANCSDSPTWRSRKVCHTLSSGTPATHPAPSRAPSARWPSGRRRTTWSTP